MKAKELVRSLLLLFVGVSLGYLVATEIHKKGSPVPQQAAPAGDGVVLYYFYGNVRCATCRKIEAYTTECVKARFGDATAAGDLQFRAVNTDQDGNEQYVLDYELTTRSVVVVDLEDGKPVRWKKLEEIWDLVADKTKFLDYIEAETRAYLDKSP